MAQVQLLSRELTNERITMPYPHVKVLEPSDALALMLNSLPKGELPVICEYKGQCRQIGSIRNSALVLMSLLKVSAITYSLSVGDSRDIANVSDIMEVLA